MPAVAYDLAIEAGALLNVVFEWREDDGSDPPSGPLVDTAGYDPRMQIRRRPGDLVLASFDAAHGIGLTGGILTLRIGADVSAALRPGVYDLELHNRDDPTDVVRLVQGKVTISPDVTREDSP